MSPLTRPNPGLIRFGDGADMEAHLAWLIAAGLKLALAKTGAASLALSGGSTPRGLYTRLSRVKLDWQNVQVTLVDERFVPPDHKASNEFLVRETLLQDRAAKAQFHGLWREGETIEKAAQSCDDALRKLSSPFDVTVLGMGDDGHTASWFPNAQGLAAALDPKTDRLCLPIMAQNCLVAGEHVHRLTLTLPVIAKARLCVLALRGEGKAATYARALEDGPVEAMPMRALLRQPSPEFWPCWAP